MNEKAGAHTTNSTGQGEKRYNYKEPLKVLLPYGMLATRKWLMAWGFNSHSLDNGVKSGTLLQLTSGVYSQYTTSLRWEGVVASVQRMQPAAVPTVHVGGISALALSGLSQYLSLGRIQTVHLYSTVKLPAWLSRLTLPATFIEHGTRRLWSESFMLDQVFLKSHEWDLNLLPVYFSCPEKAILEVIADLPDKVSFDHADELMQGLVNLSPRKLDLVLKACRSIKVKRLFFWLAERHHYPWFNRLNQDNYDLGSGKRVIAEQGVLDQKYLITVPSHMKSESNKREDNG